MNDEMRLREIQQQLQQCQMVNEVLLIVYSTIGDPIQGLPSLSERLKRMTCVLLDGMHHSYVYSINPSSIHSEDFDSYLLLSAGTST